MTKFRQQLNLIHVGFIAKGILVGLLSGLIVSLFRFLIEHSLIFWQFAYQKMHQNIWWGALVILILLLDRKSVV